MAVPILMQDFAKNCDMISKVLPSTQEVAKSFTALGKAIGRLGGVDVGQLDLINKPPHYQGDIQPIDVILDWKLDFCEGNVVKYLCRYKRKGTKVQDLEKALYYLKRVTEERARQNWLRRLLRKHGGKISVREFANAQRISSGTIISIIYSVHCGFLDCLKDSIIHLENIIDFERGRIW